MKPTHWLGTPVVCLLLASCGGGGGGSSAGANQNTGIVVSACTSSGDDSTQASDNSAVFVRSHEVAVGTPPDPVYHRLATRKDASGTDIGIDYMVHQPAGTAKGVVVLIAGGDMDAALTGTDGSTPIWSGRNFLVRSAHRYARQGYRAITIDRPDDVVTMRTSGGKTKTDIDYYRNSMAHAVDIARVVAAENADNLPVLLSGTSRGAISAAANNTLAAGIALSSALTSGSYGTPIGSTDLPASRIVRPTHILLHKLDGCSTTTPADARALYDTLDNAGVEVAGNEVSGGFRDPVDNNVCGPLDYHGYTGIENCAVGKETSWMDGLLAGMPAGNHRPQGTDTTATVTAGAAAKQLAATDADGDSLTYAVPYATTTLGGSVSVTSSGSMTYTVPSGVTGTTDSFAFTVTDGKGGVGFGVVTINL